MATIALVFAVIAYNRTGKDIQDSAADAVETTINETDDAADEIGQGAQNATDATERAIDTGPDGEDDGAR